MKKQSGFATLEALLALLIIAILGFMGWFVWNSKQQADKDLSVKDSSVFGSKGDGVAAIKKAVLAYKDNTGQNLTVTIEHHNAQYALGSVDTAGGDGGGTWFAKKINGTWQVVSQDQDGHCAELNAVGLSAWEPDCQPSQADIEKAPAEKMAFSKIPKELQQVAITEMKKEVPACVKNDQIVDSRGKIDDPPVLYAPVGSALIGMGCDGGAEGLFAKDLKDQTWKFVAVSQDEYSCNDIFSNPVPKKLLELAGPPAECLDSAGKNLTYDQASLKYSY